LFTICASYVPRAELASNQDMSQVFPNLKRLHRHTGVQTYVLLQRLGVPYEVERTICSECRRVLDERPVKRAAA
jgi:hypothetical protein